MSINDANFNLHDRFSHKVQDFVDHNSDSIRNYFQSNGEISRLNDDNSSVLEDKSILYIRNPTEDNNFYLEIYNIAAVFRFENGFFQLINHLNTILSIFNNKYKDQSIDTKKRQLVSLFKGIEEQNSEIINQIINLNFEEDSLYDIKLGLNKLTKYFGFQNIQIYYESKLNIKKIGLLFSTTSLSGIVAGVAAGIFTGSVITLGGLGLGLGIIVGIVGLFFIKYNNQGIERQNVIDQNKVKNNINKIENFFHQIKNFYTSRAYKNVNVIIVAIDKSNENYNDYIMYGKNLRYLDTTDNPKKKTLGTNREYYDTCFDLIYKYIEKYENLFNNNNANLENEIRRDFEVLKGRKTLNELKNLLNELISKEKEPFKNLSKSTSKALKDKELEGKNFESTTSICTSNSTKTEKLNNKNIKKKQLNVA